MQSHPKRSKSCILNFLRPPPKPSTHSVSYPPARQKTPPNLKRKSVETSSAKNGSQRQGRPEKRARIEGRPDPESTATVGGPPQTRVDEGTKSRSLAVSHLREPSSTQAETSKKPPQRYVIGVKNRVAKPRKPPTRPNPSAETTRRISSGPTPSRASETSRPTPGGQPQRKPPPRPTPESANWSRRTTDDKRTVGELQPTLDDPKGKLPARPIAGAGSSRATSQPTVKSALETSRSVPNHPDVLPSNPSARPSTTVTAMAFTTKLKQAANPPPKVVLDSTTLKELADMGIYMSLSRHEMPKFKKKTKVSDSPLGVQ